MLFQPESFGSTKCAALKSIQKQIHIGKKEQVYLFPNKSPWRGKEDWTVRTIIFSRPRLKAGQVFASPSGPTMGPSSA